MAVGKPDEQDDGGHHYGLVEVVPSLNEEAVEAGTALRNRSHQEFVVEAAGRTEHGCQYEQEYPAVVAEADALFLATAAEKEKRKQGQ